MSCLHILTGGSKDNRRHKENSCWHAQLPVSLSHHLLKLSCSAPSFFIHVLFSLIPLAVVLNKCQDGFGDEGCRVVTITASFFVLSVKQGKEEYLIWYMNFISKLVPECHPKKKLKLWMKLRVFNRHCINNICCCQLQWHTSPLLSGLCAGHLDPFHFYDHFGFVNAREMKFHKGLDFVLTF